MALNDILSRLATTKPPITDKAITLFDGQESSQQYANMTPEEVKVYKSIDANKPVLEQLYMRTVQKPKEISEKGMKAARTASHIGNSLGVLADMFGASQGARIARRDSKLIENQIANERYIRAQNEAENNQYESGLLNARAGDANQKAQAEREKRAFMLNLIKQRHAEKAQAAKQDLELKKYLTELGYKDKELELQLEKFKENKRHNVAMENKSSSSSGREPKFTGVVINARADDPLAQQDASGNMVIKYNMTQEEVSNIANKAKRDTNFLARHPELYITSKNTYTGEVTKGLTKDDEVAWAYLQDQYDNSNPAPKIINEDWKMYLPGGYKSAVQPKNDPLGLGL